MSTKSTASKALRTALDLAAARLDDIKAQEVILNRLIGENTTYMAQIDDMDKTIQALRTQKAERLREIEKLKEQMAIADRYHVTLQGIITRNLAKAASDNSDIAIGLIHVMARAAREVSK